jgi:hypothetical protein
MLMRTISLIILLASATSFGQNITTSPTFVDVSGPTGIAGSMTEYALFNGSSIIERNDPFTPRFNGKVFNYQTTHPANRRSTCKVAPQPGLSWVYKGSTITTNGTLLPQSSWVPVPPTETSFIGAQEFAVSPRLTGLRGLRSVATFAGGDAVVNPNQNNNAFNPALFVEAIFFSDRPCFDASVEYGIYRFPTISPTAPGAPFAARTHSRSELVFYYSIYTNCDLASYQCVVPGTNPSDPPSLRYSQTWSHSISGLPTGPSGQAKSLDTRI